MRTMASNSNRIVAALLAAVWISLLGPFSAHAQSATLDALFERLQDPATEDWEIVEADILLEWSKSGSPAMDLLLKRGRDAMEAGDLDMAIERFSALIDHAPEFAEGWNSRATAYFLKGQMGLSVADIRQTLLLNPRHFGALSGFALILEETGHADQALEVWEAAHAIHPHHPGINDAVERLTLQEAGRDL